LKIKASGGRAAKSVNPLQILNGKKGTIRKNVQGKRVAPGGKDLQRARSGQNPEIHTVRSFGCLLKKKLLPKGVGKYLQKRENLGEQGNLKTEGMLLLIGGLGEEKQQGWRNRRKEGQTQGKRAGESERKR